MLTRLSYSGTPLLRPAYTIKQSGLETKRERGHIEVGFQGNLYKKKYMKETVFFIF